MAKYYIHEDDINKQQVRFARNNNGCWQFYFGVINGDWGSRYFYSTNVGQSPIGLTYTSIDGTATFSVSEYDSSSEALTLTAEEANSTVKLTATGSPTTSGLQYRTNENDAFSSYTIDTVITLNNVGDYVQFKNTEATLNTSTADYVRFVMTGKIAASGNIQSMLNWSDSCTEYCYYGMFRGCASLTQAPELPATTLANYCYDEIFYNCTSLTQALVLPATALTVGCYSNMFTYCTALTQVPELPVTTLADYCYLGMFYGCTSLTQAPELPATTLADDCYNRMFGECTSLTKAPELPATTLADDCYNRMFYGCTSLTQAPILHATALAHSCYKEMFYGCTSLTKAPELPATTLDIRCYYGMFRGCASLTQAPELPATILRAQCYYKMFLGCNKLNNINVGFTTWMDDETTDWVSGVASSGTFVAPSTLPDERGADRIPEGWTFLPNDAKSFTITGVDTNPEVNGTYVLVN